MKKMILSAAVVAIAGLTTVKANPFVHALNPTAVIVTQQDSVKKTPVKLEDLPAAVKTTLQSEPLKVYTAVSAVWVESATASFYQINIKKDADEKYVKIDKDGKIVQ